VGEVQVFEGDGVRPAPTTYEEVVERLMPIFLHDEEVAKSRQLGDGVAASIIIETIGLTKPSLLADRLAKIVYNKSDLTLQECYDLPVERLASKIGGIIWEDMIPKRPPKLYYDLNSTNVTVSGTGLQWRT
jgi:hypothetical protein